MSSRTKTISRAVGVLYLLGTIFGVLGLVATNDVANSSDTLAAAASNQTPLAIGALLVLAMGSVLAMIPVVAYPVLCRGSVPVSRFGFGSGVSLSVP